MKFDPTCRCCCIQTSYENPIRSTRDDFEVEDYEAFQNLLRVFTSYKKDLRKATESSGSIIVELHQFIHKNGFEHFSS
ncbi:13083_t:CDS:2 [Cetraspora pellucida]|uniref:13083_t:CDS:1 n=1 Tax=Cetraspora pellucida TaxID=1433469 RepID=A0A9N8W852_9GLOM|nr:13083_t:CDS:2 [Cetraspora pellucida]